MLKQKLTRNISCSFALLAAVSMAAAPAISAPIRLLTWTSSIGSGAGTDVFPGARAGGVELQLADYHNDPTGPTKVHKKEAKDIVKRLNAARALCGTAVRVFRIDCLADQYDKIAKTLPKEGEFKAIKAAMKKAADDLAAIASANRDTSVKPVKFRINKSGLRARSSRTIKAIQPARQAQAERQASAVVDQLSTVLLRSGENSGKRQVYFAQIAQAVDSNKVLLRSA